MWRMHPRAQYTHKPEWVSFLTIPFSADAGGFPISQLLFTPDEIAAGEIDHAIR